MPISKILNDSTRIMLRERKNLNDIGGMKSNLQTTSWDNSNIYSNFQDPQISEDLQALQKNIEELHQKNTFFENLLPQISNKSIVDIEHSIPLARQCYRLKLDSDTLVESLHVYARTAATVNSLNSDAQQLLAKTEQLLASLTQAHIPLQLFLLRSPKNYLDLFLDDESVNEIRPSLEYSRENEDFLLNIAEENLLEGLSVSGFHAWARLYSEISGSLQVDIDGQKMGLAQASNLLFHQDQKSRKIAYHAINKTWEQNEISAASILNSLTGWRLESNRVRSKKRELHYLDSSCHQQKIKRATLETLIQTTYEYRHIGHRALKLMAIENKIANNTSQNASKKLNPWDLLAPYPSAVPSVEISLPEAMQLITKAFERFSPDMADFAKHMFTKNWIDATPSANRASGAYCTDFAKVREPRVFITYDGSLKNLITLAHELGHAYHYWVMKDMKLGQTHYSASLAETASIFAETLVRDYILENAQTSEEKKSILWQELESAASLLINIPARFEFECRMFEQRKLQTLSATDLKNLNKQAWQHWYEDTLTDYNEMFWASKLHFSKSRISFYNYPYLFGYLFSLGIYAKKNENSLDFKKLYIGILRDTGTLSAEVLIQKYFNEDITQKYFWVQSLKIVEKSINDFERLTTALK